MMTVDSALGPVAVGFRRGGDDWPDRLAVVAGDVRLTYRQTCDRVDDLARVLRSRGVGPEVRVAVCLSPGAALPVAMLGIWQAGGVYVPVDPEAPVAHRRYILQDCEAAVLLVESGSPVGLNFPDIVAVEIDAAGMVPDHLDRAPAVVEAPAPGDLAYVIYTSGSTGRPKGVLVEHGSLAQMAANHERELYATVLGSTRRAMLNHPVTSDPSISEMIQICFGRTLYVAGQSTRKNPDRMAAFLTEHGIDIMDGTPSQIRMLLMAGHLDTLGRLRVLILGGEAIDPTLWQTLHQLDGVAVFNAYGPTECGIDVTFAQVRAHPTPTIGHEFLSCAIHLLDDDLRPVPTGDLGEICVAGVQVARGYLNAPEQTERHFVDYIPPGQSRPERIYRTGDRARRTLDGRLEFVGRIDDQVKVRGLRVELGEVEAAVRRSSAVLDAVVLADGTGLETVLRAFVVLAPDAVADQVQQHLAEILPVSLLPILEVVPRIPLSSTGKADRKILLAMSSAIGTAHPGGPAGPQAGAEPPLKVLAALWREVLGVADIAPDENFFDLGGDSIKATRLTLKVRKLMSTDVPVSAVFKYSTFAAYSDHVVPPSPAAILSKN